jgi:malate permease and related proteins
MAEAFFGAPSMATGILIDQLGTYLVLSTLGITVATIYSAGTESKGCHLQTNYRFPAADHRAGSRFRSHAL